MPKVRLKDVGTGTFFGELLYERAMPKDHPLHGLERAIDCTAFADRLVAL